MNKYLLLLIYEAIKSINSLQKVRQFIRTERFMDYFWEMSLLFKLTTKTFLNKNNIPFNESIKNFSK